MIERTFLLLFLFLTGISNINAAQIIAKKTSPSGEERWYVIDPPDSTVNCPQQVRSALNKMIAIYNNGAPDKLVELFAPGTQISGETQMFDKPPQSASQSIADMIDTRKTIRNLFDNYQYFLLSGSCSDADDKVIYKGSDVEILAASNKRTVFGYSAVTYEFRKNDYKIIYSYSKGKVGYAKQ